MAFITPSDVVARLINSMETVPRCLTGFYHVTNQTMLPSNTVRLTHLVVHRARHWRQRRLDSLESLVTSVFYRRCSILHKKTPKVSYSTHTYCELTMPNLYAHSVNCYLWLLERIQLIDALSRNHCYLLCIKQYLCQYVYNNIKVSWEVFTVAREVLVYWAIWLVNSY